MEHIQDDIYEMSVTPTFQKYWNEDGEFGIFQCKTVPDVEARNKDIFFEHPNSKYVTLLVSNVPKLALGKLYRVKARMVENENYGTQYKTITIYRDEPITQTEEQNFIKALVTETQYNEIISIYSSPVTSILNNEFDYNKVKGIGAVTYENLVEKVESNFANLKLIAFLSEFGVSANQARKIGKSYEKSEMAIDAIKNNPYILYKEVEGFGFIKADEVAFKMGIGKDDPRRIFAVIMYMLEKELGIGNTWMTKDNLIEDVEEFLKFELSSYDSFLDRNDFVISGDRIALAYAYECELEIADRLVRLHQEENELCSLETARELLTQVESELGVTYTDEQRSLIDSVVMNQVNVLTANAGAGKSFTTNALIKVLDKLEVSYLLMSPTAKAAKVMTEYTNRPARTIHRSLSMAVEDDEGNAVFPHDVIIVDEMSMVDIFLFRAVVNCVARGAKILLIGDDAQLESISAGNVLSDIKNSNAFANVYLSRVFRQALDSGILDVATKVRTGEQFVGKNDEDVIKFGKNEDLKCWFGDRGYTADRAVNVFKNLIKTNSIDDIVVMAPMKNGSAGIKELNNRMQSIYNPYDPLKGELKYMDNVIYRVGDKVMNTKNLYNEPWRDRETKEKTGEKGIFNGDVGIIIEVNNHSNTIYVDFGDDIIIMYKKDNIKHLTLAYCSTVHKMQGAGCKNVILALDFSHYIMLKRNLLYTAITRAKERLYLIGEPDAYRTAINNDTLEKKRTFLCDLLDKSNKNA